MSIEVDESSPDKIAPPEDLPENSPARNFVPGYPRLAYRMAQSPQSAIFRRFSALNVQNLLYFQAELKLLEDELRDLEKADATSLSGERRNYSRDWYWLEYSKEHSGEASLQRKKFLKVRKTLKEYNKALLLQTFLANIPTANPSDLRDIHQWLFFSTKENFALTGNEWKTWGTVDCPDDYEKDLIALQTLQRDERLARQMVEKGSYIKWLLCGATQCLQRLFQRKRCPGIDLEAANDKRDEETGRTIALTAARQHTRLVRFTTVVTAILASFLPVASITILYYVKSMTARLAVVGVCNVAFSFVLKCLSSAKLSEVFSATAAFAAVQVVFVGTSGGNGTMY